MGTRQYRNSGAETRAFPARLDESVYIALSKYADLTSRSMNSIVNDAVSEYVIQHAQAEVAKRDAYDEAIQRLAGGGTAP